MFKLNRPRNYILDANGEPVPEPDILKFGRWYAETERHLAQDYIGGVHVSTVFLGFDHALTDEPPVLWETMIFGGEYNEYQDRYSSREEALAGHKKALDLVRSSHKE